MGDVYIIGFMRWGAAGWLSCLQDNPNGVSEAGG